MRGTRGVLGFVALAAALVVLTAAPTSAATAPIGTFPTWVAAGSGQFDGTFAAASGFPVAHVSTDNTGAGIAAGKSAFLGATTGFGQQFGSSRLQPYLTISANGLAAPSTTTVTFDGVAPVGWAFALGDIDADFVSIVAKHGGVALTSDELGVRDSAPGSPYLNYCRAASPKPTGCSALDAPYDDFPIWCPTGAGGPCTGKPENTLLGHGTDTSGSYQWFVPTLAVDELTLTFTAQLGFPSYQLWLVAPVAATEVTGTIELVPGEPIPAGVQLQLEDVTGTPITDMEDNPVLMPVESDGTFSFVTENGDYLLDIIVPDGALPADFTPSTTFPLAFTAEGDTVDLGTLAITQTLPTVPTLAATGSDASPQATLAAALLLFGAALLTSRRLRRR